MTIKHTNYALLLFCIFLVYASARPAHAYIDPGTGSYVFQMAIASALTGLYLCKGVILRAFHALFKTSSASSRDERTDD